MSANSDTVCIVLVNWNGWKHTVAACQSLEASTHKAIEIVIVDNASVDDSLLQIRASVPHAHIISSAVNTGFAGACNLGIRRATELGCKFVFLLNNDALIESDTITRLVSASSAMQHAALLGSAVVYISSGQYQFFGSRTGTAIREPMHFRAEIDGALLSRDLIESDTILGAALFIPSRLLKRIGSFDERFFLNYEETDFCYRARKLGISCFVVPESLVHHHANAAVGSFPAPMQAYFLTRNSLLFAEIHGDPIQRRPLFFLKRLYWDIRRTRKTAPGKILPLKAILRAYWDYVARAFGDCPAIIRRMDAVYRGTPYLPSSRSTPSLIGRWSLNGDIRAPSRYH